MLVAIFGIAGTPAVSCATAVRATKKETQAEKLKKALEACKKDKSKKKRKACEHRARSRPGGPNLPTSHEKESSHEQEQKRLKEAREAQEREETRPGMLVVHVIGNGGPPPGGPHSLESQPLRVSLLGPFGEITTSTETTEHTLKLAPGEYLIEVLDGKGGAALKETKATVSPAQEQEVTIEISIE